MEVRVLTETADLQKYDAWVRSHPEGSLWQSLEWKGFQESLGRRTRVYVIEEGGTIVASALVVIDKTSFGLSTWEIPRGPLVGMENGKWKMESDDLLSRIIADARRDRSLAVYISPSRPFSIFNFQFSISCRHVHPEATRILDLTLSDEDLLNQMKPKGRYNIRLAEKHGVRVERSDDVDAYAALAEQTARRDGFRGHSKTFYGHFLNDLPGSFLLLAFSTSSEPSLPTEAPALSSIALAKEEGAKVGLPFSSPIAGLLGVIWGSMGIYYYGASGNVQRELMAPYLLQWEAMRLCRSRGCTSYDLFGIAPEGSVNHPWSGVTDFKAKFGGSVVTYPPEQEAILRPGMKALLGWKRRILG